MKLTSEETEDIKIEERQKAIKTWTSEFALDDSVVEYVYNNKAGELALDLKSLFGLYLTKHAQTQESVREAYKSLESRT